MGDVLNSATKWILTALSIGAIVTELVAVFGGTQLITDAMVELGAARPWVFYWLGGILGHFVLPLKPRPPNADTLIRLFVYGSLGLVVAWELLAATRPESIAGIESFNTRHLWVAPLVGFVGGSRLWPRGLLKGE